MVIGLKLSKTLFKFYRKKGKIKFILCLMKKNALAEKRGCLHNFL